MYLYKHLADIHPIAQQVSNIAQSVDLLHC